MENTLVQPNDIKLIAYKASVCISGLPEWQTFAFEFRSRNKGEPNADYLELLSKQCVGECIKVFSTKPHCWIITESNKS